MQRHRSDFCDAAKEEEEAPEEEAAEEEAAEEEAE